MEINVHWLKLRPADTTSFLIELLRILVQMELFNTLNVGINPIFHLLVLLGGNPLLHFSRITINRVVYPTVIYSYTREWVSIAW
jgi:hypothetical protein